MLNSIELMGRLAQDPVLKYTASGTAVTTFALAVERDFSSSKGEKEVDFIDCVAWNREAEYVNQHYHKGMLSALKGKLQISNWEDRNGNKRKSAEVVVESIYFAESKRPESFGAEQGMPKTEGAGGNSAQGAGAGNRFYDVFDDGELPF